MRKIKSISILASIAALAMTSCGGEAELNGPAGSVSAAAVPAMVGSQGFTAFLGSLEPQTAGAISPPGLGGVIPLEGAAGLAEDIYSACTSVEGSPTDGADGDGIPLNYKLRFNCDSVADLAALRTMIGTYTVTDKNDNAYGVLGGFKFSYDILQRGQYFVGRMYEAAWSGNWEATTTATSVTLSNDYTIRAGEDLDKPDMKQVIDSRSKFDSVYTPVDIALPFQAGTVTLSGLYRFSGSFVPQGDTTRYDIEVAFEISSSGLEYGANGRFKEGSFTLTDGAGNRLVYTYQNFNRTVQFNGQIVP